MKEGPVQRRRFLDLALSQLRPRYASLLSQYNRALAQRNILLKDIAYHSELMDTLAIWDERLAMLGAQIIYQRRSYVDHMQESAVAFYHGLSRGREELSLAYASSIEGRSAEEIAYELSEKLTKNRAEDLKMAVLPLARTGMIWRFMWINYRLVSMAPRASSAPARFL